MTTTTDRPAVTEAPAIRVGMGVTLHLSDCPDPVFGVVTEVYTDVLGGEAAEIAVPGREATHQCTRFLTVVTAR